MDWTSIVYYGDMVELAKYGYSRDHRPDKKQVTLGVAQLAPPVNVPIGLTMEPGNVNDQEHFRRTYDQVRSVLSESSLIVFDKGANDKRNLEDIVLDRNDYLTSKKLNMADDKVFLEFSPNVWERIDVEDGVYALKRTFSSRVNYYFFSERLKDEHLAARRRKAERLLAEARVIQRALIKGSAYRSASASTILSWVCATSTRRSSWTWTRRRRSASSSTRSWTDVSAPSA